MRQENEYTIGQQMITGLKEIRVDTRETRKKIGFPKTREAWAGATPVFDKHTLRIMDHPVMEDWETPYMAKLAEIATSNGGVILELGLGMGISALDIQSNPNVVTHYIVEANLGVVEKGLKDFHDPIAKGRMHILSGFWEDVVEQQLAPESFDGILFDTYPLKEQEIHGNHFSFLPVAFKLLRPGGILTYYSDEATDFSPEHRAKLIAAGFRDEDIGFELCQVNPPADCEYWQSPTIIAPIVRKAA